jgi:hypothetical protein
MNIQEMWPEITSFIRTVLKETVEVKHWGEEKHSIFLVNFEEILVNQCKSPFFFGRSFMIIQDGAPKIAKLPYNWLNYGLW